MSQPSPMRRLIRLELVADKMGMGKTTFARRRADLENDGFPAPLFGGGKGSPSLWDERAIDAWLDQRMPEHLRPAVMTAHAHAVEQYKIADTLQKRAATITL